MAKADVEARYDAAHSTLKYHDGTFSSWSAERNAEHPFHYRGGVALWVHTDDLTPDDDFLSAPHTGGFDAEPLT